MHTIPDRRYTVEFQEAAVQKVLDSGQSINEVAGSLEMPARTLGNWVRRKRLG
jgi:transposase-like protein